MKNFMRNIKIGAARTIGGLLTFFYIFILFLPKIYCILHLLSYLCALEIIPLLALGVSLIGITERLSLIF